MTSMSWGLLRPDKIARTRRSRTLGLGAAVRCFNDLAVPGVGGLWFGKPLLLALLGIQLAEQLRAYTRPRTNIQAANAVEALACWLAYQHNGWEPDARLKGRTKLPRASDAFSFKTCSRAGFYVTQPMRMATVQALPALGLVCSEAGERFNAYRLSEIGERFVEVACPQAITHNKRIADYLLDWSRGGTFHTGDGEPAKRLCAVISPAQPLPKRALGFLQDRLLDGDAVEEVERRRTVLEWLRTIDPGKQVFANWKNRPAQISELHWRDLAQGAVFFQLRDAAQNVLLHVEREIATAQSNSLLLTEPLPTGVLQAAEELRESADRFLRVGHDPTPNNLASDFARECTQPHDVQTVLETLVNRDGRMLRLADQTVVAGPAFVHEVALSLTDAAQTQIEDERRMEQVGWLPPNVSYRIPNLYQLGLDLHGELDRWLFPDAGETELQA